MADTTIPSLRRAAWILLGSILVILPSIFFNLRSGLTASLLSPRGAIVEKKGDERKRLPSLKNGGVVFFLHVPKAGGTTIRELVKYQRGGRRSKVHYVYLTGPREFTYAEGLLDRCVIHGTGSQVVFLEYHALDRRCPTFLRLQSQLGQWKRSANENNVPFFAFSILREPLAMAVSFHNFYHLIPQNPLRFDWIPGKNATDQETFFQTTIANPQCLFLARNEDAYTKTGQDLRATLTREECREAYAGMHRLLDWVGTTDRIRNETLPLLKELFQTNPDTKMLIRNMNKTANPSSTAGKAVVHVEDLSPAAVAYVRNVTTWDQEIYDWAQRDFSYQSWTF